ncbi:MAG: TrkA C-terminal domain-containing protein [Candidatus Woesearchaeota archaeon]
MGNIKENILKLKDMSELMVDLSYSAVFLHDTKICKEVEDMFNNFEKIEEEIYRALFKIRDISDEERLYIMEITDRIKGIADNAKELSRVSKNKKQPDIIQDIFSNAEKRVIVEKVPKTSIYVKKTIGELKIRTLTRGTIVGIKRNDNWIFNINKDTTLDAGDEIVLVGSAHTEKLIRDAINNKI